MFSFLEVSCILIIRLLHIILFLALPCSLLQQLQSFSGIIIIIELTPGPIPRAISQLRGPSVTQAERKKTQGKEEEGREGLYTGGKGNRLLWHGL